MKAADERMSRVGRRGVPSAHTGRGRMRNAFFDFRKLKHLGKSTIIGEYVRIRHPRDMGLSSTATRGSTN